MPPVMAHTARYLLPARGWARHLGSLGSCPMAHNPHAPQGQGPEGNYDPAGSTQMFRAFVDEGAPQGRQAAAPAQSSARAGLIAGVIAAVVILGAVAWLALG